MPNPWLLPQRQFEVFMLVDRSNDYVRLQDIADELRISKTTAQHHVEKLIAKGYLIRDRGVLRAVPYQSPAVDTGA